MTINDLQPGARVEIISENFDLEESVRVTMERYGVTVGTRVEFQFPKGDVPEDQAADVMDTWLMAVLCGAPYRNGLTGTVVESPEFFKANLAESGSKPGAVVVVEFDEDSSDGWPVSTACLKPLPAV